MGAFDPSEPTVPDASQGPNPANYALPGTPQIAGNISAYQGLAPVTGPGMDPSDFASQMQALGLFKGAVNGTTPSASAAGQQIAQDNAMRAPKNTHDLGAMLMSKANALQGIAQQGGAARLGEMQQGGQMYNTANPAIYNQALGRAVLDANVRHANNAITNQGLSLQQALQNRVNTGNLSLQQAQEAYNNHIVNGQLTAGNINFNNTASTIGAVGQAAGAGLGAAAYLYGQPSSTSPSSTGSTDLNHLYGNTYGGITSSSSPTPAGAPTPTPGETLGMPAPVDGKSGGLAPQAPQAMQVPTITPQTQMALNSYVA